MINKKKILAVITARGGSKGLPKKNILDLSGKPLIAWTIQAAKKSKYIDRVILSSDNDDIIKVSKKFGCEVPFKRPQELSGDEASSIDVLLHAIKKIPGYDYVILLQPTSPLRSSSDIDDAFKLMISSKLETCTSVCETQKTPYWMFEIDSNKVLKNILDMPKNGHRRQSLPKTYELNGAIYISNIKALIHDRMLINSATAAYVMSQDKSVDIDDLSDFNRCKKYIEDRND